MGETLIFEHFPAKLQPSHFSSISCSLLVAKAAYFAGSMSQKPVRIGFVGVGGMGQMAHLRNYASASMAEQCEVVAIAECRTKLGNEIAKRYGVPRVYNNHEELFANEKLDGVVASQGFNRHVSLVPELYKAGIPVFTEKPLSVTVAAGEKILSALKTSGTWHMVGYHKRSDPATMFAKAEIDRLKQSGELGKLNYIRITMPPGDWIAGGFNDLIKSDEPVPADPNAEPVDWKDPLFIYVNYYIHQVNLLRHLFGEKYKVVFSDKSGKLLVAESESGVTGIIEQAPFSTKQGWQESALVAFEKGYVKLDLPAPVVHNQPGSVTVYTEKGYFSPQLPPIHAMRQQAINFCRALRGEIPPMCDAVEALEDLKIARDYLHFWKGAESCQ